MSKETFKSFVKNNPSLIDFVNSKEKTWQEFYEMYELYGANAKVWDNYIKGSNNSPKPEEAVKELVNMIKGIDLETVQKGITNVQKTISLVQDLGFGSMKSNIYEKRSNFEHFND